MVVDDMLSKKDDAVHDDNVDFCWRPYYNQIQLVIRVVSLLPTDWDDWRGEVDVVVSSKTPALYDTVSYD